MSRNLTLASDEERTFYRERLYPLQDRVLAVAGTYEDALVLTGGTALARCYFDHRFSDDIDLFHAGGHVRELARDFAAALRHEGFEITVRVDQPGFSRFVISEDGTALQVDVAADLPRLDAAVRSDLGVYVHTLRELGANKIVAFEDRVEAKDAVDLYYLTGKIGWEKMVADADAKRVPLDYESLQRLLSQPIAGKALLIKPIEESAFAAFFSTMRSQLTHTIEKKTDESRQRLSALVADLLWDAPKSERTIDSQTLPVLRRRAQVLPLPERIALSEALR